MAMKHWSSAKAKCVDGGPVERWMTCVHAEESGEVMQQNIWIIYEGKWSLEQLSYDPACRKINFIFEKQSCKRCHLRLVKEH